MPEEIRKEGENDTQQRAPDDPTMDDVSWRRICSCFRPVAPVLVGFSLGLILMGILPKGQSTAVASSFFMLLFGVIVWGVDTAFLDKKPKQLHCGGSKPMDEKTRRRYKVLACILLALVLFAAVSLGRNYLVVYFAVVFVIVTLLAGEIGWGGPLIMIQLAFGSPKERS